MLRGATIISYELAEAILTFLFHNSDENKKETKHPWNQTPNIQETKHPCSSSINIVKPMIKSLAITQKGESQNGCFKKTKHTKFFEKRIFLTTWYHLITVEIIKILFYTYTKLPYARLNIQSVSDLENVTQQYIALEFIY